MKRKVKILTVILFIIFSFNIVKAADNVKEDVSEALNEFVEYLNEGNSTIYYYMDTTNTKLYGDVQKNLHDIEITDKVIEEFKENEDGTCETKVKVTIKNSEWKMKVKTIMKWEKSELGYILSETDLFDITGADKAKSHFIKNLITIVVLLVIIIAGIIIIKKVNKAKKLDKEEK